MELKPGDKVRIISNKQRVNFSGKYHFFPVGSIVTYKYHFFPVGSIVTYSRGDVFEGIVVWDDGEKEYTTQHLDAFHWVPLEKKLIETPEAYKSLFAQSPKPAKEKKHG